MNNYNERCEAQGLNKDWGIELCRTIINEFEKGKRGGYCCPSYIAEKIGKLESFIDSVQRGQLIIDQRES